LNAAGGPEPRAATSNIETIDPKTLHLSDEFTEANLGTKVEAGGQVTTRIVTTQFAFDPPCVIVPANEPVTLRLRAQTSFTDQCEYNDHPRLRVSGPYRLNQDRRSIDALSRILRA
jgi:hypothetical protein